VWDTASERESENLMYRNFNPVGAIHELPLQANSKSRWVFVF
jgi:hypothetical protein